METMDEVTDAASTVEKPGDDRPVQMRLQMKATDHADQPVFANFTAIQGAPGMVFLDFGFLEPAMLPGLARLAQSGGRMPEQLNGKLACRVVLGMDTAAQLARQLDQHLHSMAPPPRSKPN